MDREQLLDLGTQKRNGELSQSWDELNIECNYPFKNGEGYRSFVKKALKKDSIQVTKKDKEIQYKETVEIHSDGRQTSDKLIKMSEKQSKDVEFLLKSHGFCVKDWELVSARNNIWNAYSKLHGVQVLYASKITVKPRVGYIWNEEDAQKIFNNLKTNYKNKIDIKPKQYEEHDNILFLPLADFHLGLSSDKFSTGNDYNLEIAEELYYYTLNDIINRVKNRKFEKVLFVVGNDFINADNLSGTTTKGTPQDNSDTWFNIVNKATELIINGVDMLSTIAPVDLMCVPSNHDLHTMFGVMQTIKAWYRNDKNVNVNNSPLSRQYYQFGETLIALSHDIKVKEVLKIITSEGKKEWSNSTHILCVLAHLHQSMIYEKQGYLEIMRLPTISGWSRWTNTMGYIQSDKKNQAFIINKELGITDTFNTVINI